MKGTCHTDLYSIFSDTFLVVAGRIGVLSETSRCLTDIVAHEFCRLKEKLCGVLCDLTVHAAHDTRKGYRFAAVADHEIVLV